MPNVESNKTQQYLTMDHTLMLFSFLVCIICGYITARKTSVDSVTYDVNTNGSITLTCRTHISGKASEIDHIWIFLGNFLTKNTDILPKNPPRYIVKYQNNGHDRVYTLTISNPVQEDEGSYKCRIDYKWKGTHDSLSKDVDVTIDSYLPPLNYPVCSIRPSQTLSNGNFGEFECDVGETNVQITLNLTLQSDDGSITILGNTNVRRYLGVRKPVTLQDNMAMFICHMTSQTFHTAYRNCSAGPLTILEVKPTTSKSTTSHPENSSIEASQPPQNSATTQSLPWTSQPKTSSRKFTTETYRSDPTSESNPSNTTKAKRNYSNKTARKMYILTFVGCAIGTLFLLLLIICGVIYQRTSKDICIVTSSLKSVRKISNAKDNVSSAKPRRYRKRYEPKPSTVARQLSSQDTGPNQIPLYAVVHQTNSEDENSLDTKATNFTETDIYEDIDLPAQDNSSESMSKTKTLGARAMANATGKNEDVELLAGNQTTTSGEYDDVKLPAHNQTPTRDEYDAAKLPVHNQTPTPDEYDDAKLPVHN